ncbi:MAG: AbrB/MazE/SpoVT family DNA-binding domain-containing protein [Pyrinomonadaceae bacterium]
MTLPKEIPDALGARPGGMIVYEVEGNVVRLKRLEPFDAACHKALSYTLSEWASDEDEETFDAL